jgi:hypothetical protein
MLVPLSSKTGAQAPFGLRMTSYDALAPFLRPVTDYRNLMLSTLSLPLEIFSVPLMMVLPPAVRKSSL